MASSEGTGVDRGQDLDWRSVEWPKVSRAVYEVHQRYTYSYTAPVSDISQRLMMIPRDRHGDQRLLSHQLTVEGADDAVLTWKEDDFGNRLCLMRASRVAEALIFDARYRVQRVQHCATGPGAGLAWTWDGGIYTEPTALTDPDARLRSAAAEIERQSTSQRDLAERALDWAAQSIAYQLGVTGVQTPAAMALHLGKGVCQDYAHIMLAVLRLVGIPARYVSGHLLGEGAPHAWVEALLEDANGVGVPEVVAFDPTHNRKAGLNYLTVAVGRDYADVRPTSGTFSGPAAGRLASSKQATIVEVAYEDGTVAWSARKTGESAA